MINILSNIYSEEEIRFNVPLKKYTTMRTGGPADIMVFPDGEEKIIATLAELRKNRIPHFLMGRGSNLIVRDGGIRGVVINLMGRHNKFSIRENTIYASAGCSLRSLSLAGANKCLQGLEFAAGIPGTLGGAVVMNGGAYGGEMKDVITRVRVLNGDGTTCELEGNQCGFGYRRSIFQENGAIVLGCEIRLDEGRDCEGIGERIRELDARRKESQPLEHPSAGSVFKRPPGHFAGPLIESCGLKGRTVGGAMVSQKHCGFIINTGNATSRDVIDLIRIMKDEVYKRHNVELETEVKIIGEEL